MKITILCSGSRGDTQPYIALGVELKKAGHAVRLATHENYASFVQGHGLDFFSIRGDVSQVVDSDNVRGATSADNPLKVLLSFNKLRNLAADLQTDFFQACLDSDALVYHPGLAIGYFAARKFNIPGILAAPFPMTPTREYPSLLFYDFPRLGRKFNLLTYKFLEQLLWFASSNSIRSFWKKKFGEVPESFGCPYARQNSARYPTIVSCSNHVFARPVDWPDHVHNTGFWFLEEEAGWQPSDKLLRFLEDGKPPVYIGFGSMSNPAQAVATTRLVADALRQSGQRGLLATGWKGLTDTGSLPENIFVLESAPHAWLFPRMAAVIHHGGAGTTAAGLRAGVPSIVIPFTNDQFGWGRRVYELSVGPKPIRRKQLTPVRLGDAIQAALSGQIMAAARELGEKIRSENGVNTAARIIQDTRDK